MTTPRQRVDIYRGGARGAVVQRARYKVDYVQKYKASQEGYTPCPRCGRMYKNPERAHMSDPKNRTPCMEAIR